MPRFPMLHWRQPLVMVGALLAGIILAVGHDQFYHNLDNTPAPIDTYIVGAFTFSKQQANLNIGFALAFLVKICLVSAALIAFAQVFWKTTGKLSNAGGIAISKMDSMHLATSNLLEFLAPRLWMSAPGVVLIALGVWLIPIASIITPGTLSISVRDAQPLNITETCVPSLDFRSLKFSRKLTRSTTAGPSNYGYDYTGPHRRVLQVAQAVSVGGDVLPIASPAANASWVSTFYGPALSCSNVQGEDFQAFLMNVAEYISVRNESGPENCYKAPGYLSWIKQNPGEVFDLPYKHSKKIPLKTYDFDSGSLSYERNSNSDIDLYDQGQGPVMASVYVATLPNMLGTMAGFKTPSTPRSCAILPEFLLSPSEPLYDLGDNATLIQCELVNSTYTVAFNFVDGSQYLDVDVIKLEAGIEIVREASWATYASHDETKECLQNVTAINDPDCTFDHNLLWRLSYQSIMSAFSSMVKGQVTRSGISLNVNTSVTLTTIGDAAELQFLNEDYLGHDEPSNISGENLQDLIGQGNSSNSLGISYIEGLDNDSDFLQPRRLLLHEALEELFQNVTISMLSQSDLWANISSITAPPAAQVTFPLSVPTYVYTRGRLWLTYGIAIFLSLASTVFGMTVIVASGRSFDCNFSTFLRTTRHAELDREVAMTDAQGHTPLPRYLADSRIRFLPRKDPDVDPVKGPLEMENLNDHDDRLSSQPIIPPVVTPEVDFSEFHESQPSNDSDRRRSSASVDSGEGFNINESRSVRSSPTRGIYTREDGDRDGYNALT